MNQPDGRGARACHSPAAHAFTLITFSFRPQVFHSLNARLTEPLGSMSTSSSLLGLFFLFCVDLFIYDCRRRRYLLISSNILPRLQFRLSDDGWHLMSRIRRHREKSNPSINAISLPTASYNLRQLMHFFFFPHQRVSNEKKEKEK